MGLKPHRSNIKHFWYLGAVPSILLFPFVRFELMWSIAWSCLACLMSGCLLGLAKEVLDKLQGKVFDLLDWIYTIAGGGAMGILFLIIHTIIWIL